MKDLGHLCPSRPCSDRISFILAVLGICLQRSMERGRMWDPWEVRGAPTSRVALSSADWELLSIIIIFYSHSSPAKARAIKKKRGDPSFMQISLPKITHLAHSRAFITSVKLSGEPGQRKSVGFNPQILIEMTERRSYRGHFRAAGRPTFSFFFFEGPEMSCVSGGGG